MRERRERQRRRRDRWSRGQRDAGPWAKECRQPLETEEDKETDPPGEPPRNTALPTHCRLQTSRTPRVQMCIALNHPACYSSCRKIIWAVDPRRSPGFHKWDPGSGSHTVAALQPHRLPHRDMPERHAWASASWGGKGGRPWRQYSGLPGTWSALAVCYHLHTIKFTHPKYTI